MALTIATIQNTVIKRLKISKFWNDKFNDGKNAKDIFIRDGKSGLKALSFVRVPAAIKIQCLWRSYIAYQEMAYMRTMMINVSEMNTFFNEIWSKYDTNSRGYIEATETRLMIQDFSGAKELQKEEVHSFLVRIDKDGNGKIDKKELVHFIVDGIAMEEEEKIDVEAAAIVEAILAQ